MSLSRHKVLLARGVSYTVTVGPGASEGLAAAVAPLHAARIVVVSDSNVELLHGRRLAGLLAREGRAPEIIVFPAGEARKTRETKAFIEDRLAALGCGRDTAIVAVGGGVTGDLAGFVAATWMRGIAWVQVPTSLLAMADASIGGKTGVDHPAGKNLIGAFHQPASVLADTSLLATLPPREFRSGLAEIVKAAIVGDAELFGLIEEREALLGQCDPRAVAEPLSGSIRLKASIVSEDGREEGRRSTLNFGHTIGHALERISGYSLPHGEAVSAGMVAEARIAAGMSLMAAGDADRIQALLSGLGLPVVLPPGAEPAAIIGAMALDKKSRGGHIELALPERIGRMASREGRWTWPAPEPLIMGVLADLGHA